MVCSGMKAWSILHSLTHTEGDTKLAHKHIATDYLRIMIKHDQSGFLLHCRRVATRLHDDLVLANSNRASICRNLTCGAASTLRLMQRAPLVAGGNIAPVLVT